MLAGSPFGLRVLAAAPYAPACELACEERRSEPMRREGEGDAVALYKAGEGALKVNVCGVGEEVGVKAALLMVEEALDGWRGLCIGFVGQEEGFWEGGEAVEGRMAICEVKRGGRGPGGAVGEERGEERVRAGYEEDCVGE